MKELIYANWSYQIEKYLLLILALLDQPDPYIEEHCKCFGKKYCPCRKEISMLYMYNWMEYERIAKEWTKKYAT